MNEEQKSPIKLETNGGKVDGRGKSPGSRAAHFKPGQVANPAGRPKGRIELATVIKNFLNETEPKALRSKVQFRRTRLYALLERIAIQDPRCLLAYGYGKPIETVEVGEIGGAGLDEKPEGVSKLTPQRIDEIVAWVEKRVTRRN